MDYPKGVDPEAKYQHELQQEVQRVSEAAKAIKVRLTERHRDLLSFVEQYWYSNQAYPSVAAFARYARDVDTPVAEVRSMELDLIEYLKQRGISPKAATSRLSAEQLAAANLILNYADKRSKQTKLASLGISVTKWDGWCRERKFVEYLKNRSNQMLDINLHVAHGGLLGAVERGEAAALKLYYEMTGIYKADTPQANINVILAQLIEVIQREIQDPDVLRKIASGFELVMLRQGVLQGAPSTAPEPILELETARDLALDAVMVDESLPERALVKGVERTFTVEDEDIFKL